MHEFEPELVPDLLERFGRSFYALGKSAEFSAREGLFLILSLAADPASRMGSKRAGWKRSSSREEMVLMDIWDVLVGANGGKSTYPRPWPTKEAEDETVIGGTGNYTGEELDGYLAKRRAAQKNLDLAAGLLQEAMDLTKEKDIESTTEGQE